MRIVLLMVIFELGVALGLGLASFRVYASDAAGMSYQDIYYYQCVSRAQRICSTRVKDYGGYRNSIGVRRLYLWDYEACIRLHVKECRELYRR